MVLFFRLLKAILKLIFNLILLFIIISVILKNSHKINKLQSLWSKDLKYILVWGKPDEMWNILEIKQNAFRDNECEYTNCYVTYNTHLLKDRKEYFTAILINGKTIAMKSLVDLPKKEEFQHKYTIFAMKESAAVYPVCHEVYDNYFNHTWTYKLDSDAVWKPFIILDEHKNEIGPKINMTWKNIEVNNNVSEYLKGKKLTAAWIVSDCDTRSTRENMLDNLKRELRLYGLEVHTVGSCGSRECLEGKEECNKELNKFYFYIAYESSIAEDYVSEDVLKPLFRHAIPIVFGGADYLRFLPPKSFINAKEIGPRKTAHTMFNLIRNKREYVEYFKWVDHYYYSTYKKPMCELCALLNKDKDKVYKDFRKWWRPNYKKECGEERKRHDDKNFDYING